MKHQSVVVIGGGPAGLMAADVLTTAGIPVEVYDCMPSVGRKFLVAGKGGLNLTHAESRELFLSRYGSRRPQLEPILDVFGPDELREWVHSLGIQTFVGTSGHVFPVGMKTYPILRAWLIRLRAARATFHFRHRWIGWNEEGLLKFETPDGIVKLDPFTTILALGGGSWPQLGSSGTWAGLLAERGIRVSPLRPSNCGFDVPWSEHFRTRFKGIPLKSVTLSFTDSLGNKLHRQGEFVITSNGVEGSLVYAFSAQLRDEIAYKGKAVITLDLAPGWSRERLIERLSRPRGSKTISTHLEKSINIKGVKAGLIWEFVPKQDYSDPDRLADAIKGLSIPLIGTRPLVEAISSAGGVNFEDLDEHLMLRSLPGVFCAGEMLDWEAPTGGYLLTACFSTGRAAGLGALAWLQKIK